MGATVDLNLLTIFAAVAEAASFSAAARKLKMPVSSVSRAVAGLEEDLGVRLLHRTTRRVAVSTAGDALLERIGPSLVALERAVAGLPEREEVPSGELRVTAPNDIGTSFLPELVARFTARYPTVRVDVHVSNQTVDLVGEGFDLALRASIRPLRDSSLRVRKACSLPGGLFASPRYLARRGTPRAARDLEGHDLVLFRGVKKMRLHGPETETVSVQGRVVTDDMLFLRAALRAGGGLGDLPLFLAAADVAAGDLVRVLPRHATDAANLWLATPATRHPPPKLTAFRDLVLETLRSRPLGPER